jgi:hypothetical protein
VRALFPVTGIALTVALVTSCSSTPDPTGVDAFSQAPADVDMQTADDPGLASGTGGELIPITSDNVARAGYDALAAVMIVQFRDGSIYEYYDVPLGLWERFIAAQPDPWSQVGYPDLVQGGYSYRKVAGT